MLQSADCRDFLWEVEEGRILPSLRSFNPNPLFQGSARRYMSVNGACIIAP